MHAGGSAHLGQMGERIDEVRLKRPVAGMAVYKGASPLAACDQPFGFKRPQSPPHRGPGHAMFGRQILLDRQGLSIGIMAARNPVAEDQIDLAGL